MTAQNARFDFLHIYCGDGKGKTTAAVGLAVRFSGSGGRVLFTQFLKDGTSSELASLREIPGIEVFSFTEQLGFSFRMSEEEKRAAAEKYTRYFQTIAKRVDGGDFGLLVLDEAVAAYNLEFIDRGLFLDFLDHRPKTMEVVLTGRDPAPELCERADYISEICKRKHPFDAGVSARQGIEY